MLQIKEARSGLSTQQTLRVRAAKSWLQQRWRLCLLGAFLLLLFVSAVVRFSAYDPYRASQLQQEDILASVRCAIDNSLRQQYTPFAIRLPYSLSYWRLACSVPCIRAWVVTSLPTCWGSTSDIPGSAGHPSAIALP